MDNVRTTFHLFFSVSTPIQPQQMFHWGVDTATGYDFFMETYDETSGVFGDYQVRTATDGLAPLKRDQGTGVIMTNQIDCGY